MLYLQGDHAVCEIGFIGTGVKVPNKYPVFFEVVASYSKQVPLQLKVLGAPSSLSLHILLS